MNRFSRPNHKLYVYETQKESAPTERKKRKKEKQPTKTNFSFLCHLEVRVKQTKKNKQI